MENNKIKMENFEKWLIRHNFDKKQFISALDRAMLKMNLTSKPLIFYGSIQRICIWSLLWSLLFSFSFLIFISSFLFIFSLDIPPHMLISTLGLILFGGLPMGLLINYVAIRNIHKINLPPWESFSESDG